jgi:aspartyl-tRNA(Asn)/glutamyl-tRNA(Gln) amidotransferase subunit B
MNVLNNQKIEIDQGHVTPNMLRELFEIMDTGEISGKIAKEVFKTMVATGKGARVIIDEEGLKQVSDKDQIFLIVDEVLKENAKVVKDIKGGKLNAFGFLVGQVMKKTKGKANPKLVNEVLKDTIERWE